MSTDTDHEPPVDTGSKIVDAEVRAIASAYEALRELDSAAKQRAVNWLTDKFGLKGSTR